VRGALEAALEAEMTEALGAEKGKRTEAGSVTAAATTGAR
jgi:transposase-like protein